MCISSLHELQLFLVSVYGLVCRQGYVLRGERPTSLQVNYISVYFFLVHWYMMLPCSSLFSVVSHKTSILHCSFLYIRIYPTWKVVPNVLRTVPHLKQVAKTKTLNKALPVINQKQNKCTWFCLGPLVYCMF